MKLYFHKGFLIITNKFIPFYPYNALMFMGILFIREYSKMTPTTISHEKIHLKQWLSLTILSLPIGLLNPHLFLTTPFTFYILYLLEYFIKLLFSTSTSQAYRSVSFEVDAYLNQSRSRRPFTWLKYIFKIRKL